MRSARFRAVWTMRSVRFMGDAVAENLAMGQIMGLPSEIF